MIDVRSFVKSSYSSAWWILLWRHHHIQGHVLGYRMTWNFVLEWLSVKMALTVGLAYMMGLKELSFIYHPASFFGHIVICNSIKFRLLKCAPCCGQFSTVCRQLTTVKSVSTQKKQNLPRLSGWSFIFFKIFLSFQVPKTAKNKLKDKPIIPTPPQVLTASVWFCVTVVFSSCLLKV